MGGADVVLLQHLEHAGARHARDQRHVDERQVDARAAPGGAATGRAVGERRVALHRQPVAARSRRPRSAGSRPGTPAPRSRARRTASPPVDQRPARYAASMPSGTARAPRGSSSHSAIESVGSSRCASSSVTGTWVKIEVPRSPLQHPPDPDRELRQQRPVEPERDAQPRCRRWSRGRRRSAPPGRRARDGSAGRRPPPPPPSPAAWRPAGAGRIAPSDRYTAVVTADRYSFFSTFHITGSGTARNSFRLAEQPGT